METELLVRTRRTGRTAEEEGDGRFLRERVRRDARVEILRLDRLRRQAPLGLLRLRDGCNRRGRRRLLVAAEDVVELIAAQGEARLHLSQPLRHVRRGRRSARQGFFASSPQQDLPQIGAGGVP